MRTRILFATLLLTWSTLACAAFERLANPGGDPGEDPTPTIQPSNTPEVHPTFTPVPRQATPESIGTEPGVIYQQDFGAPAQGWLIGSMDDEYGTIDREIVNGYYEWRIDAKKSVFSYAVNEDHDLDEVEKFALQGEVEFVQGSDGVLGALVFHSIGSTEKYVYDVSKNGDYLVLVMVGGQWRTLVDRAPAQGFNFQGSNLLRVEQYGDLLVFKLNGIEQTRLVDTTLRNGTFGLGAEVGGVENGVLVRFDNVRLEKLSEEAEPPPAPLQPTATAQDLGGEVLLDEQFEANTANWPLGVVEDEFLSVDQTIADGMYHWELEANQPGVISEVFTRQVDLPEEGYVARLRFRFGGEATFGVALLANRLDDNNRYTYRVYNDGYWAFYAQVDGAWEDLFGYVETEDLYLDDWNTIQMENRGGEITLWINGVEQSSFTEDRLSGGKAGMAIELLEAGDQASVDFDSFQIYPLDSPAALLPPGRETGWTLAYLENFDQPTSDWFLGDADDEFTRATFSLDRTTYRFDMEARQPVFNENWLGRISLPEDAYIVEASFYAEYLLEGDAVALVVNRQDTDHKYAFRLTQDGLFSVVIKTSDGWEDLVVLTESDGYKLGEWNTLAVRYNQGTFEFLINDILQTQFDDLTYQGGYIGLVVDLGAAGNTATVFFDDVRIWR